MSTREQVLDLKERLLAFDRSTLSEFHFRSLDRLAPPSISVNAEHRRQRAPVDWIYRWQMILGRV